jgi:hypothetical protein
MQKILLGSIVFTGIYNLLFYPTLPGIGLVVLFLLIHVYLYLVRNIKTQNLPSALFLSGFSIIFAAFTGWRANGVVQFLDILFAVFLAFISGYLYKIESKFSGGLFSGLLIPASTFIYSLFSILNFFSRPNHQINHKDHSDLYKGILRGLIIAIPIILLLFMLLIGADPIFRTLIESFSFTISTQLVVSIFIFLICLTWGFTKINTALNLIIRKLTPYEPNKQPLVESLIVSGSIVLLFTGFIGFQIRYLFLSVPELELKHLGINVATYSEFVRQGFFQLLMAAAISGSVIAFILNYLHQLNVRQIIYLKVSMLILALETELLLVSAGKRLFLYEQAHGLTRSRILGVVFLIWLAIILIVLFGATLKKIKSTNLLRGFIILTICAFISINIIPIDYLIATKYQPTVNHEIDYIYLMGLSSETAEIWPKFITESQNKLSSKTDIKTPAQKGEIGKLMELQIPLYEINNAVFYLDRKYNPNPDNFIPIIYEKNNSKLSKSQLSTPKWQTFNLCEYNAYKYIINNREKFIKLKTLLEEVNRLQNVSKAQK